MDTELKMESDIVMVMDKSYYPYIIISLAFWLALYQFVSPVISGYFFPKYKSLSKGKQVEWDSRFNSSFHSLIVSSICVYALAYDKFIHDDPVWGDSHLVKYTCAIVIGYMTFDCVIIIYHYKEMGEMFYFLHHGAAVYAFWFVITYGVLPWFANFRLIAEFSTPFVNQRWFLDVLDHPKDSKMFMYNGIMMAVMFFIVRIGTMPSYWYKVYSIYGTEPCDRLGNVLHVLTSSCFILDSINLYWMYRIYLGAQKVLKKNLDKNRNIAPTEDFSDQAKKSL